MNVDSPLRTLDYAESDPPGPTIGNLGFASAYNHFSPQTGFTSVRATGINQYVRHMFGTGLPKGYVDSNSLTGGHFPLLEVRQQTASGNPSWHDHGRPGDHDGVAVGPGGAVSVIHDYEIITPPPGEPAPSQEEKYVFVPRIRAKTASAMD